MGTSRDPRAVGVFALLAAPPWTNIPRSMPYAHVHGVRLYYETHGAGARWLVIAHGALGSTAHSHVHGLSAARVASHGVRVVAYDARGHGRSAYTTRSTDYHPRALARDLLGLLDHLGIERADLCGTSMGASTVLSLALDQPQRVARLVLVMPAPFEQDMRPARLRMRTIAWLCRHFGGSFTASLLGSTMMRTQRERTRALLTGSPREAVVPLMRGFLSRPLEIDALSCVDAPALVVAQPHDALHPLRSGHILREHLPHSKLLVAPARGYWNEHRDELARVVGAWVNDQPVEGVT